MRFLLDTNAVISVFRNDSAQLCRPIGPYDVLIAGQATARSLTLITHNVSEFARVTGLDVEDWQA